jgi:hypothetical protein
MNPEFSKAVNFKELAKISNEELLSTHNAIADEYANRLCKMYGFDRRYCWWVSDSYGGVFIINDIEYSIGYEDIVMLVDRAVDFATFNDWFQYNLDHMSKAINLQSWLSGLRPSEEDRAAKDADVITSQEIIDLFSSWAKEGIVCSSSKKGKDSKQIQSEFNRGECALTIIEGLIVFTPDKEKQDKICKTINSLVHLHRVGKLLDFQVFKGVKSKYDVNKKVKAGEFFRFDGFGGNIVLYIH